MKDSIVVDNTQTNGTNKNCTRCWHDFLAFELAQDDPLVNLFDDQQFPTTTNTSPDSYISTSVSEEDDDDAFRQVNQSDLLFDITPKKMKNEMDLENDSWLNNIFPSPAADVAGFDAFLKGYPANTAPVQQPLAKDATPMVYHPQAMPNYVAAPVNKQQQAPQPDLEETGTKKKAAKRRRGDSKAAAEAQARTSPVEQPSTNPSPVPDQSLSDDAAPTTEKEAKRQKRLIKNRESAQASRERKKAYVQGLEKKMNDLSNKNSSLNNRVLTLEEENYLLRERLKRMDRGDMSDPSDEPEAKRRRLSQPAKIPIPPYNPNAYAQPSYNPLNPAFWGVMVGQQPYIAGQQPTPGASRRVVLFIMIFCVAILVASNSRNGSQKSLSPEQQLAVYKASVNEAEQTKRVGRKILEEKIKIDLNKPQSEITMEQLQPLFDKFSELMSKQTEANVTASMEKAVHEAAHLVTKKENVEDDKVLFHDESLDFTVQVENQNLIVSLPKDATAEINNTTGDNNILSISKQLLKQICEKL